MRGATSLILLAFLGACTRPPAVPIESASLPVYLTPPYSDLPAAPSKAAIERGTSVPLSATQQEAVILGVTRWMKYPDSVSFGGMAGARNSRGWVTVCGDVNGRNASGKLVGMAPFVGVLMGWPQMPQFVVVEIGADGKARTEVEALCRESGIVTEA
jgi:hypothetical protein